MTHTQDILTRLRAAKGPDRDIDFLIAAWRRKGEARAVPDPEKDGVFAALRSLFSDAVHFGGCPSVTSSIDAALALVLEKFTDAKWALKSAECIMANKTSFWLYLKEDGLNVVGSPFAGLAATPPLAVLVALFEALAKKETNHEP